VIKKKRRWTKWMDLEEGVMSSNRVFEDDLINKKSSFLTYGFCDQIVSSYGDVNTKYKALPYKKYIHRLKKQIIRNPKTFIEKPFEKYAYITSRVKRAPMKMWDKYLMILDTDGIEEKDKAVAWLNKKEIRHFLIQSSPNKFWIICDKIDTVDNLTHMMDEIPGVDTRFTDCSREQGALVYRGFPKPGFIPQFDDISKFTGMGLFEKWILKFKNYWESDDVEEISNNLFMEAI